MNPTPIPTPTEPLALRDAARLIALAKGSQVDLDAAAELLNEAYPQGWPHTIERLWDSAWLNADRPGQPGHPVTCRRRCCAA